MARARQNPSGLIEQTISSLVNGVSRQPARSRLSSQCEEQDNVVSDVALGAIRRPPTEHIAKLVGGGIPLPSPDGAHFSLINRGDDQQFLVVLTEGDVNVYNVQDGSEVTVAKPGGSWGLNDYSGNNLTANEIFETVTIADYTFIVNKTLETATSGVLVNPRTHQHEFLLSSKSGATSGYYNIIKMDIGGDTRQGAKTNGTSSDQMMDQFCYAVTGTIDPQNAPAIQKYVGRVSDGAGGDIPSYVIDNFSKFKWTRLNRNVLHAYQYTDLGNLLNIDAEDFYGDTIHELMTTSVTGEPPSIRKFSDVPAEANGDFVIEVAGDEGNTEDSFFVKYNESRKTWEETVKPNLDNDLDPTTFPHVLIYNQATGAFSYEQGPWASRLVGDEFTAPLPASIGKAPQDVFIHENRLALLLGENVLMSESGDFFNFFPTTVTALIDSDPIDIAGTGSRVAIWDYAVPVRRQVLLFSAVGDVVAVLSGAQDKTLSLENAKIQVQGTWAHSDLRPQNLGNTVYYTHDKGGSSSVSELKEQEIELWSSDEVTAHIANYVPTNLVEAKAGVAEQMIVYRSSLVPNELYIYAAETIGGQPVISSWSKWIFDEGDEIIFSDWVESILYITVRRSDGIHLEKLDFGKLDEDLGAGTTPLGHRVHMDSLVTATGSYNVTNDTTTWTLPYSPNNGTGEYQIIRGGAWGAARGSVIAQNAPAGNRTLSALGDYSAYPVYIGREYLSNYQMSEIVKRDADDLGEVGGRLQVRRGRVVYSETGAFDVVVSSLEDDSIERVSFVPTYVGGSLVGAIVPDDGSFQFYIGGRSEDVRVAFQSSSFLPFRLSAINWQGRYYNNAV